MHYAQCVLPTLAIGFSASAHLLPVTADAIDLPADLESVLQPRQNSAFPVGADCAGSDGAWNCLTTAWQRCVTGNWTDLMNAAPGTMCKPVGLSFDFHVVQIGDTTTSFSTSTACTCVSTTHKTHSTTNCPASSTPTTPVTWTTSPQIPTPASTCTSTAARSTYENTAGELVSGGAVTGSRMLVTSAAVGLLAVGFARLLM